MTAELLAEAAAAADRRDWTRAADLLSDAPPSDGVLDLRGWYSSRAKRYEEAIAAFQQLRARRPADYLPPYMIGYQLYQQERWAEALPFFDEALRHRPDHIKSLWRRAYALHRLGREKEALVTAGRLLRAWTSLPEEQRETDRRRYAQACHLVGRYQCARDPAGAVDLLREAVRHEPDDPFHHYQLSKALRRAGHADEAVDSASAARRLKPGDVNIEIEYATALTMVGRTNDAVRCIRSIERRCTGWNAYRVGLLMRQVGDRAAALRFLQRAARDRPTRDDAGVQHALADLRATDAIEPPNAPPAHADRRLATPAEFNTGSSGSTSAPRTRRQPPSASAGTAPRMDPESSAEHLDPDTTTDSFIGGVIQLLRPDRRFGFILDEDGVRRFFRIADGHKWHKGDRVLLTPVAEVKGPAARDVRPA